MQVQSHSSKGSTRLQQPFPLVKPHEWERRKAQIQKRHPHIDVEFYQDTQSGLWTMRSTCRKTGQVQVVASHSKPYSALHFGMERLVDRAIVKKVRQSRP